MMKLTDMYGSRAVAGAGMRRCVIFFAWLLAVMNAYGWSQKGHDVTCFVAEKHLTPKAAAAVDSLLEGRSMVYWANWLDNASHTPEYAYSKTWHYNNVDEGERYETRKQAPDGDAITALRHTIGVLSGDRQWPEGNAQLALKMLIHIMGDIHQPLHMGHATDLGGNRIKVKFFGNDTNLHSVWDHSLPEATHKWSYTEWQQQIDRATPAEQLVIISGNIDDWGRQSVETAAEVYRDFPAGKNISYNDIARWAPVVEDQYLKGGLRLAHVLNLIFDPGYRPGTAVTVPSQF